MTDRLGILHRARHEQRYHRAGNAIKLHILAGQRIVETGPAIVRGPDDLRRA